MKNLQKTKTAMEVSPKKDPSNCMYQTIFKLPCLEGDTIYSPQMQKGFKTELMASIVEELGITIDDLQRVYQSRNTNEEE